MASSSKQMTVNAEQLRAITTELVESPEFQETLKRILTPEISTRPTSRITALTFSNVEEERASLFHHHQRTAATRNQHQQHHSGLRANPFTQSSTGLQPSFLSLTAAARGRFFCLPSSFLIQLENFVLLPSQLALLAKLAGQLRSSQVLAQLNLKR